MTVEEDLQRLRLLGWPAHCPAAVDALVALDRMDYSGDDYDRADQIEYALRSMAEQLEIAARALAAVS